MIDQSVVHQFLSVCRRSSESNALHVGGRYYTYAELEGFAGAIRARLVDRGVTSGQRVGVLTGDDVATYASILAVLSLGAAYVPIGWKNPPDRMEAVIRSAGLEHILASREHEGLIQCSEVSSGSTKILSTADVGPGEAKLAVSKIAESDLAYLFFTSGSTGRPKGVPIYHRNLNAFLKVVLDPSVYDFRRTDRFLQMFELTFDLSVTSFLTPLCIGASCDVVPEKGIASINVLNTLVENRITVALMVPSMLSYLKRFFDELTLPDLRYSLFCGEALPQSLTEAWSACTPRAEIQNVYGPTEATIFCLIYPWQKDQSRREAESGVVAIGKAMPGMQAFVVNEQVELIEKGERGELCLVGEQVTDQYWQDGKKTEAAFVDIKGQEISGRAYRTGDVCFINENDNFVYCGRVDFQVQIEGYRVELGEIEHWAREFAGQSMSAAIAVQEPNELVSIRLVVENQKVDRDQLRNFLEEKLPEYMVPREIILVDSMPLNQNGKIDRRALESLPAS